MTFYPKRALASVGGGIIFTFGMFALALTVRSLMGKPEWISRLILWIFAWPIWLFVYILPYRDYAAAVSICIGLLADAMILSGLIYTALSKCETKSRHSPPPPPSSPWTNV